MFFRRLTAVAPVIQAIDAVHLVLIGDADMSPAVLWKRIRRLGDRRIGQVAGPSVCRKLTVRTCCQPSVKFTLPLWCVWQVL